MKTKQVAEVAEIELNNPKGEQLELSLVSDSDRVSLTENVSDKKRVAIQRYLDRAEKETIACITAYSPGKRKTKYYRLSYRFGRRIKHIHIKGGSTISQLATYRAKKIQALIDRGAELSEVIAAVRTYNQSE